MPTEAKPLFRAEALRPRLATFAVSPTALAARPKLVNWAQLFASKQAEAMKETELLPEFLTDVFSSLLGYTGPADGGTAYTLKREANIQVDGKFADATLGRFSTAGGEPQYVAVVEGKGPRDRLDRPFGGRKLSAVAEHRRRHDGVELFLPAVTGVAGVGARPEGSAKRRFLESTSQGAEVFLGSYSRE